LVQAAQVPEQPAVEAKTGEAAQRSRDDRAGVATEIGVHRRRQQPELQDDDQHHEREHGVDDRHPPRADQPEAAHVVDSSTPVA